MGRVVVRTEALAETLPDEREGSQGRDQRDLKRVPKQISKVGFALGCAGIVFTSIGTRYVLSSGLKRSYMEYSLCICALIFIIKIDKEDDERNQSCSERYAEWNAIHVPSPTTFNGIRNR